VLKTVKNAPLGAPIYSARSVTNYALLEILAENNWVTLIIAAYLCIGYESNNTDKQGIEVTSGAGVTVSDAGGNPAEISLKNCNRSRVRTSRRSALLGRDRLRNCYPDR